MTKNILIVFIFSALLSCTVSTDKFPEPENLKRAIANSIEIPFQTGDTIIYDSYIEFCGDPGEYELNRLYDPRLYEQPFNDILRIKTKRTTLCTGDSLYALMNRLCKNNGDSITDLDCYTKNKIMLSIIGEAVTNSSVKIYEDYGYNNEHIFIEKLFNYSNHKWTFNVVRRWKENNNY